MRAMSHHTEKAANGEAGGGRPVVSVRSPFPVSAAVATMFCLQMFSQILAPPPGIAAAADMVGGMLLLAALALTAIFAFRLCAAARPAAGPAAGGAR